MEESEACRLRGNDEYKAGNFENAVQQYSMAIEVDPKNTLCYSNRSAAYLQLKNYPEALKDAKLCTQLDPSFAKGYFRLGSALEHLDRKQEALEAFLKALSISPHDQSILQKASLLKKQLKVDRNQTQAAFSSERHSSSSGDRGRENRRIPEVPPANNSWVVGLSPKKQLEWLIDCYRMRVDDMAQYGMGAGGLYNPDNDAKNVVEDFLVFCKLAVKNGVIPDGWDWKAFLEMAGKLLAYAFEKSDAKEKYGSENVFAAMLGGRSLRFTAECVYESSCLSYEETSEKEEALIEFVGMGLDALFRREPGFFDDVGGVAAWRKLPKQLQPEMNKSWYG